MKFALSTNWCNRRMETGEEIADAALELGFEELELGYHTTFQQVKGFKARLDSIPVGSVHAFCPVPISAPQGYPELYSLASFDDEDRKMAKLMVGRNVRFAAEMGADALVLHAGRVMCHNRFFPGRDLKRRVSRGRKMVDVFKRELEALLPELEKNKVVLGLECLPYLEGFPAEWELKEVVGEWVKPWLDVGHDFVRKTNQWNVLSAPLLQPVGLHLADSKGGDDHLPPGEGKIDFASLKDVAVAARHLVLEPSPVVTAGALRAGLAHIRNLWTS